MDAKQKKKHYGVTMAPIACTEAWVRTMAFDHNNKGVVTFSYILVNRYTGERIHTNTYNGDTGPGYNATKNTHKIKGWGDPVLSEKALAKALGIGKENAYRRCPIAACPVAVLAEPPADWSGD